jgi:hypothetical protein
LTFPFENFNILIISFHRRRAAIPRRMYRSYDAAEAQELRLKGTTGLNKKRGVNMEESGEQCTVVFALIVTELASFCV